VNRIHDGKTRFLGVDIWREIDPIRPAMDMFVVRLVSSEITPMNALQCSCRSIPTTVAASCPITTDDIDQARSIAKGAMPKVWPGDAPAAWEDDEEEDDEDFVDDDDELDLGDDEDEDFFDDDDDEELDDEEELLDDDE
jgi:hypothetical protein